MNHREKEILSRFEVSWTETETYFDELIANYPGFDRLKAVRKFITDLRNKGEHKFFRLGTSIHVLLISRSVNGGLRSDQKRIKINALDDRFNVLLADGNQVYREYIVEELDDTRVIRLLETLKDTLVD